MKYFYTINIVIIRIIRLFIKSIYKADLIEVKTLNFLKQTTASKKSKLLNKK